MHELEACVHAYLHLAEVACVWRNPFHHDSVRTEEVVEGLRVLRVQGLVCRKRLLYLPNLTLGRHDTFAVDNSGCLIKGERIALNPSRFTRAAKRTGAER